MTDLNELTVKVLAELSGVSVRTLHYYDEIGLLKPERTSSDYRVYGTDHILRLQQILIQKSLGLSLASIKAALDDPNFDHLSELNSQRQVLLNKIETTKAMILAIDAAIAKSSNSQEETKMSIQDIFNGFNPEEYNVETEELWGETKAYKVSQSRTKRYKEDDWKQLRSEEKSIWVQAAEIMSSGLSPLSAEASEIVARHRRHIDKWFYSTSSVSYASLADMWESDDRFESNIDKYGEGLTVWFAEAARNKYGVV